MALEFKTLVDQHNGILYKIGRIYTQNSMDFDDLYQEMLIQLWKSFAKFKGESKITTFIYRIALNTALTYKRDNKKHQLVDSIEQSNYRLENGPESAEHESTMNTKVELLYKCINLLKKEDRAIILLQLEGNSYEEIAEIIGLKPNHIGVKIKRIKERLHKLLKEHSYGRI